jgi:pimeloyl-ACP methyl ester carboxylesterase
MPSSSFRLVENESAKLRARVTSFNRKSREWFAGWADGYVFSSSLMRIPSSRLPLIYLALILVISAAGLRGQGSGAKYELIGRYEVERLNQILTKDTPAFTGLPVAYSPARNAVKLYRVTYPSVIPERGNRPTLASGLLAIPETEAKTLPLLSYQHGTVFSKRAVPSFPDESPETQLMIAQFAGQGYVVIGADYFGMGTSTEMEGYVVMGSHQQACMDLYFSALGVLETEGIRIEDFFVTGWSQGGVVTMAFLEMLEKSGISVRAASTASAQCDARVMLNGFLSFPREIDAPWVSAMFILSAFSLEEYHGIPGLARALFTPEQYEIARKIYQKEPFDEKDFPGDLRKLIRSEYFDPQYFAESAYGKLIGKIHPYRWLVRTPVRMYYGEMDECLSVGLARLPMVYQQSMGNDKVEALSAGPEINHRGTFGHAAAEWKAWFDLLRNEKPAK